MSVRGGSRIGRRGDVRLPVGVVHRALDAAAGKGMKVILSYWESSSSRNGTVDNLTPKGREAQWRSALKSSAGSYARLGTVHRPGVRPNDTYRLQKHQRQRHQHLPVDHQRLRTRPAAILLGAVTSGV